MTLPFLSAANSIQKKIPRIAWGFSFCVNAGAPALIRMSWDERWFSVARSRPQVFFLVLLIDFLESVDLRCIGVFLVIDFA